MDSIIHFEIHAEVPERAARFYRAVFNWEISEVAIPGVQIPDENRYWSVTTRAEGESGINGGILFRRGPRPLDGQPVNAYVCTVGVGNLDESVHKALNSGGSLTLPRMPVKGIGWLAHCKDTEGNIFGLMEEDTNAQ
jgi:predicted enzyme related to lactoylglutathione lyase